VTGQQNLETKYYFERIKTALVEGRPAEARRVRLELYSRSLEMASEGSHHHTIFDAEDAKKVLRARHLGIPEEE
jgi:hypothetical protein